MDENGIVIVFGIGGSDLLNSARGVATANFIGDKREKISEIIFTGGHTYGRENPSEAEKMRDAYISANGPQDEIMIQLEEHACDTRMNIANSLQLAGDISSRTIYLLAQAYHLPRIVSNCREALFKHMVAVNTDDFIPLELREKIHRDPYYLKLKNREPILRIADSFWLTRAMMRFMAQKRIQN